MSKFRKLVEGIMFEYYDKNGRYTLDPLDDYDFDDEYYEWLDDQDYKEGYAVYLNEQKEGHDLFATADKSVPNDPEYKPSTQIFGVDSMANDVFEYGRVDSPEEAEANAEVFLNEWKERFPESNAEIVKVYSRDEDGYEFHRTKEECYPYEEWFENQLERGYEHQWEADNER